MIFPQLKISLERWKFNKDYSIYVSTHGRFKDTNKNELKFKFKSCDKYPYIQTSDGYHYAHKLVMTTWKPSEKQNDRFLTIEHKDQNPRNCWLNNLEWISGKENNLRGKEAMIPEPPVVIAPVKITSPKTGKPKPIIEFNGVQYTKDQIPDAAEAMRLYNPNRSYFASLKLIEDYIAAGQAHPHTGPRKIKTLDGRCWTYLKMI